MTYNVFGGTLNLALSILCTDVPLRNCSLTHYLVYLICNVLSTCSFKSCMSNTLVNVIEISTVLSFVAGLPQRCVSGGAILDTSSEAGSRPADDMDVNSETGYHSFLQVCSYLSRPPSSPMDDI